MYLYPMILTPDDNGTLLVTFPDVPEAITCGDDEDAARLRAEDALLSALQMYVDARRPLPKASAVGGREFVLLPTLSLLKLALYDRMLETGTRKADLARSLNWHLPQVDRVLDLEHDSRLDQVEAALRALGSRIEVKVRAA